MTVRPRCRGALAVGAPSRSRSARCFQPPPRQTSRTAPRGVSRRGAPSRAGNSDSIAASTRLSNAWRQRAGSETTVCAIRVLRSPVGQIGSSAASGLKSSGFRLRSYSGAQTPEPLCPALLKSATETKRTPTLLPRRHITWQRRPTGLFGRRKRMNSAGRASDPSSRSLAPPSDRLQTTQGSAGAASAVRITAGTLESFRSLRRKSLRSEPQRDSWLGSALTRSS